MLLLLQTEEGGMSKAKVLLFSTNVYISGALLNVTWLDPDVNKHQLRELSTLSPGHHNFYHIGKEIMAKRDDSKPCCLPAFFFVSPLGSICISKVGKYIFLTFRSTFYSMPPPEEERQPGNFSELRRKL